MNSGAWGATVHRVAKSQTPLKQLSTHTCTIQTGSEVRWGVNFFMSVSNEC